MSTERRLDRLGLLHLKDDPVALHAALAAMAEQARKDEEAWEIERQRILAEKAAQAEDGEGPSPRASAAPS